MNKKIILIALFLMALFGCNFNKNKAFDCGTVKDNVYTNTYFNIEFKLPEKWVVQSKEQIEYIKEVSKDFLDNDSKKILEAGKVKSANLLIAYKHELGSAVDFNPSFSFLTENLKRTPGIKTGKDYLFHARKLLKYNKLNYKIDKKLKSLSLSNKKFYIMHCECNVLGMNVIQEYISTVHKKFALNFVITYLRKEDKDLLINCLKKIKFN